MDLAQYIQQCAEEGNLRSSGGFQLTDNAVAQTGLVSMNTFPAEQPPILLPRTCLSMISS
jgi:hypothetical protein